MVYWGLTPQQQPGSYQGGEMMMKSVVMVEETGVPGGNHRPTASNCIIYRNPRISRPGVGACSRLFSPVLALVFMIFYSITVLYIT